MFSLKEKEEYFHICISRKLYYLFVCTFVIINMLTMYQIHLRKYSYKSLLKFNQDPVFYHFDSYVNDILICVLC